VQELLNGVPEEKHDQVLTQLTAPLIAFIERIEREEANKPTAERRSTSDIELELAVLVRMPSLALLEARKIQKEIEKRKSRATKRSSNDKR
jgi:hypothetical protein